MNEELKKQIEIIIKAANSQGISEKDLFEKIARKVESKPKVIKTILKYI